MPLVADAFDAPPSFIFSTAIFSQKAAVAFADSRRDTLPYWLS
jgi:hypothetical protein